MPGKGQRVEVIGRDPKDSKDDGEGLSAARSSRAALEQQRWWREKSAVAEAAEVEAEVEDAAVEGAAEAVVTRALPQVVEYLERQKEVLRARGKDEDGDVRVVDGGDV